MATVDVTVNEKSTTFDRFAYSEDRITFAERLTYLWKKWSFHKDSTRLNPIPYPQWNDVTYKSFESSFKHYLRVCSNNIYGRWSIISVSPNDCMTTCLSNWRLQSANGADFSLKLGLQRKWFKVLSYSLYSELFRQLNFTPAFSAILAIDRQGELKTQLLPIKFTNKSCFATTSGLKLERIPLSWEEGV